MIHVRRTRLPRQYRKSCSTSTLALTSDRAKRVEAAFLAVAGKLPAEKELKSGSLSAYAEEIRKILPR